MKIKTLAASIAAALCTGSHLAAQGTAFTYQGRLEQGGSPYTGSAEFQPTLWDALSGGTQLAANTPASLIVGVTNGLFVLPLDFGANFPGAARWLQLEVRTTIGPFTALAPRQKLTPTPYSLHAASAVTAASVSGSVSAAQLTGTVPLAQLPASVLTNGSSGVNISGTFTGDAFALTNANIAELTSGAMTRGVFVLASTPSVGSDPVSVVAADVNGDGKVDLVSANAVGSTLSVLTNNGSGSFTLRSSPGVPLNPARVAAADLNGDGKIDLVSAHVGTNALSVMTNNGTGAFAMMSAPTVGSASYSVAAADLNGDGKPDLVSANYDVHTLSVLTNNGSGAFGLASSPTVGNAPISVAAADVNGDGKVDLVSANWGSANCSVLTNNGNGAFVLASSPPAGNGPFSIIAADVNGDSSPDLVHVNNSVGGTSDSVSVLTNNGSGTFAISWSSLVPGSGPESVATADINRDGWLDLVVAYTDAAYLSVLTNSRNGSFAVSTSIASDSRSVTTAHLDSDGFVDLATANDSGNTLSVLLQTVRFQGSFSGQGNELTSLNASQLTSGTLPSARLSGTYSNAVTFNNAANSFAGNGGGLTNVNAATLGGLNSSSFWRRTGNAGTVAGTHFLGTTDDQPLDFRVNGGRIMRLHDGNVIAGYSGNSVSEGVIGAVIGGGGYNLSAPNTIGSSHGTVSGGTGNAIQTNAYFATIGGGTGNSIFSSAYNATLSGGSDNTTKSEGSTISGGEINSIQAGAYYSTVSGGYLNRIENAAISAAISGGWENTIQTGADSARVGGGFQNEIQMNASYATIGGGSHHEIKTNAVYATIPGGRQNSATNYAFAAGRRAKANHTGAFVWADSTDADFSTTDENQFLLRASGGVGVNGPPVVGLSVNGSGAFNAVGAAAVTLSNTVAGRAWEWHALDNGKFQLADHTAAASFLVVQTDGNVGIGTTSPNQKLHVIGNILVSGSVTESSDRQRKEHFAPVDTQAVLERVSALPIQRWNYIGEDVPHIGPMAQDFHGAFQVGIDDKHISMVDADGVALAAIQGLNQKLEQNLAQKEAEIAELKQRIEKLERFFKDKHGSK